MLVAQQYIVRYIPAGRLGQLGGWGGESHEKALSPKVQEMNPKPLSHRHVHRNVWAGVAVWAVLLLLLFCCCCKLAFMHTTCLLCLHGAYLRCLEYLNATCRHGG